MTVLSPRAVEPCKQPTATLNWSPSCIGEAGLHTGGYYLDWWVFTLPTGIFLLTQLNAHSQVTTSQQGQCTGRCEVRPMGCCSHKPELMGYAQPGLAAGRKLAGITICCISVWYATKGQLHSKLQLLSKGQRDKTESGGKGLTESRACRMGSQTLHGPPVIGSSFSFNG